MAHVPLAPPPFLFITNVYNQAVQLKDVAALHCLQGLWVESVTTNVLCTSLVL